MTAMGGVGPQHAPLPLRGAGKGTVGKPTTGAGKTGVVMKTGGLLPIRENSLENSDIDKAQLKTGKTKVAKNVNRGRKDQRNGNNTSKNNGEGLRASDSGSRHTLEVQASKSTTQSFIRQRNDAKAVEVRFKSNLLIPEKEILKYVIILLMSGFYLDGACKFS